MNLIWIHEKPEKVKVLMYLGTHYSGTIKKEKNNYEK